MAHLGLLLMCLRLFLNLCLSLHSVYCAMRSRVAGIVLTLYEKLLVLLIAEIWLHHLLISRLAILCVKHIILIITALLRQSSEWLFARRVRVLMYICTQKLFTQRYTLCITILWLMLLLMRS